MKYIEKKIQNEPQSLRTYRDTTEGATYAGYVDKDISTGEDAPLKRALLKEQGGLCAYCMGPISLEIKDGKPQIEIEHYLSQEKHPTMSLQYSNLLAVCNGKSITYPELEQVHHCDKTKGEKGKMNGKVGLKKLSPTKKNCEDLLTYTRDGFIRAKNEKDLDLVSDLEEVLNLNNSFLLKARRLAMDNVIELLKKEKPEQDWNLTFLEKHVDRLESPKKDGKFRTYCMAAVWLIQNMISKPKYNR